LKSSDELQRANGGSRWSWWLAAILIVAMVFVLNLPALLGRVALRWDANDCFQPHFMLMAEYAREGQLLLWNPWNRAGSPDFAQPEMGALSPLMLFSAWATGPSRWGFVAYWCGIWALGGVGMLLLGRQLGAPLWGAALVAVAFTFNGYYIGQAQHMSHITGLTCLPWLIWRLDVAISNGSWRPAVEAGAILGVAGLSGYPGLIFLNACFAGLWAIGRWIFVIRETTDKPSSIAEVANKSILRCLRRTVIPLFIIGAVTCVILLPTYAGFAVETNGYSDRSGFLPREVAVRSNALHPGCVTTLGCPFISNIHASNRKTMWSYTDIPCSSMYIGALVLWLAFVSLILQPGNRWRWWLVGIAVLAIGLAMGRALPLRGWLYDLCFPTRYFRHASLFRFYLMFCIAVLALSVTQDISTLFRRRAGIYACVVAVILTLFASISFHLIASGAPEPTQNLRWGQAHLWITWISVCLIAMAIWRGWFKQHKYLVTCLLLIGVADATATFLYAFTVFDRNPRLVSFWERVSELSVTSLDLKANGKPRIMGPGYTAYHLPVKRPLLKGYSAMQNHMYQRWLGHDRLGELAVSPLKHVWFTPEPATVPWTETSFSAFVENVPGESGKPPVVLNPRPEDSDLFEYEGVDWSRLPGVSPLPVDLMIYRPTILRFDVQVPDPGGWLVVTDRWASGWKATVDGEPVPVLRGWFFFRAIPVTGGQRRVEFQYKPFGMPYLMWLSWATVLATVGWSGWACWQGRGTVLEPTRE